MEQQQRENLQKFADAWNKNEKLQEDFSKNTEKVCNQYGIRGEEQKNMVKIAKEGKNLKERISTTLLRLLAYKA